MFRLLSQVGAVALVACALYSEAQAAAGTPPFLARFACEDPSRPPPPGARSNEQLLANETFQRAVADVQRLSIVAGFCELRSDTLTLDLGEGAFAAASAEYNLGRLHAAYRALTEYSPETAMELRYEDRLVGWYTVAGLSWIERPAPPPPVAAQPPGAATPGAPEVSSAPEAAPRSGFHFGAGIGGGSFDQQCRGCEIDSELGLSGLLSVGRWLGQKTVLGVEATGWSKEQSERRTVVYSLVAQVTRYATANSGLFLRAGAGLVGYSDDFDFSAAAPGFVGRLGYELGAGKVRFAPYVGYVRTFDGADLKRDGDEVGFNFVISQLQFGAAIAVP